MINTILGSAFVIFGLIFLFHPAQKPSTVLSYKSLLARQTTSGFYLAQRWCRDVLLLTGVFQVSMGLVINYFHLNHLSPLWLLLTCLLSWASFMILENKLRHYLMRIGQLPIKYQSRR
ncbi:hypothetical protein [Lapidilactobacillus luobeiensis]|uniref:hypothetical protein n=1 Tax=Lapidilactobacillus luobeiensis TaxID=2950371 RepID=UPI0021C3ADA9|nr:hypothetical protein [Lapidilactobacillus luobeiensis]